MAAELQVMLDVHLTSICKSVTMATLDVERTRAANLAIQILALDSDSKGSLPALRAERTLVQERLDSYKYPVLTLPNEIVSEIFLHVLPVYPERPPPNGIHSPNNLTQICGRWRDIALTTPVLWRAIQLSIGGVRDIPFERQVHELDAWLSRSGSCPFSLEVFSTFEPSGSSFVFSAARAARWENLKATLSMISSSIIEGSMPLLRHLDLKLTGKPHPIVFGEVPLLRSVVLNDTALIVTGLPWAQLTSLMLKCVYPHECVPVLQQTPNIVYCELRLCEHPTSTWPDVTLPRLESLTLVPHGRGHYVKTRYLETFIVPALCELHIGEAILDTPIVALTAFMLKSGCRLGQLYISGQRRASRRLSRDAYSRAFPSVKLFFDGEYFWQGGDITSTATDSL